MEQKKYTKEQELETALVRLLTGITGKGVGDCEWYDGILDDAKGEALEIINRVLKKGKKSYKTLVRLSLHNYRMGGSAICDEEKSKFESIPSAEEIIRRINQHKKKYGIEPVYFNLDGVQ